jgi:hypothetical protein
VKTEDLIVQLAASAQPVEPLLSPIRRFGFWTASAVALTVVGVGLIGMRPDVSLAARQFGFMTIASLTFATALISAGAAFVLSVPGVERSPVQRWTAVSAGGAWAGLLGAAIVSGGSPIERIAALPFHLGCVAQIAALSVVPGWLLFAMLRRAAPLRHHWSAGLATLAAVALAAAGTQFMCPLDDPAHYLVGHVAPVAAFVLLGTIIGRRAFRASIRPAARQAQGSAARSRE